MPFTLTYRIFRSRNSRSSSLVGMPRRRAASDARSSSSPMGSSRWLVEAQFATEFRELVLNLGKTGEVVTVAQYVSSILADRE